MDGASAAHPKKGGAVARKRRPVFLDVHDVKQQKSLVAANARAFTPRACTDSQLARRARSRDCGRAGAREGHVGRVFLESVTGPSGPSCLFGGGILALPPVSRLPLTLAGSVRSRIGSPPVRHTRLGRRPVVRTTRRWRR